PRLRGERQGSALHPRLRGERQGSALHPRLRGERQGSALHPLGLTPQTPRCCRISTRLRAGRRFIAIIKNSTRD
ncbi:hypothetical protein D3Z48_10445, partial [Clostridiaceae bacterium]|nr:hypothetical protein [Clostridiaceae bacterium]